MCLYRQSALWAGCTILVLVLLAAEELADATSGSTPAAELLARRYQYNEGDDSDWRDSESDADEIESEASELQNAGEAVASASDYVGRGGPALPARPAAIAAIPEPKEAPASKGAGEVVNRVCRVTAYCDRGLTAAGVPSGVGQCAAPIDIPLGSTVYIPALHRKLIVTDRTHRRFRHNTVDVFIPSERQCRQFGRRYLECEFTLVDEPVKYGELRVAQGR